MNLLWPMEPLVPEQRCLAYQYTQLGRWTYFGQWTPQYQSRDALNTSTQNLADEPTLANGTPGTRAEMPCIPAHTTWQMNLLWPMDPPVPEQWCLEYQYTKLGRWTYFGQWPPQYKSRDALNTSTQNLAGEPTLANRPPSTRAEMPWIPVHKTWQMNLLWSMDPPPLFLVPEQRCHEYSTHNLADEPTLANGPPGTRAEMPWIPVHKTWQMTLLWPMDLPPLPEQRWLAYRSSIHHFWDTPQHFLKTHFCLESDFLSFLELQKSPQYQSRDALNTSTQNLADEPTLANGTPGTRAEMPCIPVHTTWQMNLLWPMDPPVPEQRCLEYQYTKFGSMNLLWPMEPLVPEQRCLAYQYTQLGRWTYFGQWTPQYQSRDALNTSTQNLADEPTLANGTPGTRAEMPCIPAHTTWQMNLLWPMDPPVPEQRCLEYQYTKLGRWTYFGQWPPQYKSRDALNTSTQNLADEPTLVNGPPSPLPGTRAVMPWIPVHKTWQVNLLWPMAPPVQEQRCHEYQYTKLGRWPYFGQWTSPHYQSRDDLHTALAFTISEIPHSIFSKHIFA